MVLYPQPNMKGIAYVSNKDDFENFIIDFYVLEDGIFDSLEDWFKFFCDGEMLDYVDGFEPDIVQLIDDIDEDRFPKTYPALVMFNFEDYNPTYMMVEEALFETIPLEALDIKSIKTRANSYTVAFTE